MVSRHARLASMGLIGRTAVATALAVIAGGGLGIATLASIDAPGNAPVPLCRTSGPIAGLTSVQGENARIIVGTAEARAGKQASLVALMTAMAESDLRILANPNDPAGAAFVSQGTGYDHDSLGLFQQRPGWGSAAKRMSAIESTTLFIDALLQIPNWAEQPPWRAAQLVQKSAFDGRPRPANGNSAVAGENYLRQAVRAVRVQEVIDDDSATLDCGGAAAITLGGKSSQGLPRAYSIPSGTSQSAVIAITFALAQLGKPYAWGAAGPATFDCSGLTQAAWQRAGTSIGRTTWDQLEDGTTTTLVDLSPGDLILTPGGNGTRASPGHVGMYLGRGLVIHAPRTGDVIKVTDVGAFTANGISSLRHIR